MSSENDEKRLRDQRGTQTSPTPSEEELMLAFTALPSNIEQKVLDLTGLIQAKAKQLRSKPQVSWLPYLESGLISSQDYAFITAFQHSQTKEERDKLLNYFKGRVFDSLVRIVHRVCLVEEIQKFLVLIDDMLWEDTTRVSRFKPEEMEPWKAFLDLLSCSDDFVRNMASRIISKFITYDESKPSLEDLNYYFSWLNHELQQGNIYLQSVARCLQLLLSRDQYRVPFMKLNGIHKIIRLLSMGVKPQDQYQLCFCLWVTSFNPYAAERINRYGTIPILVELLERCPGEILKIPRMILAVFRNMLEKPREEGVRKHNALMLVQCKIFKNFEVLEHRVKIFNDPEYIEDFKILKKILIKYLQDLTSFDEYYLEVKSGQLEWSVVHTSKHFWEKNAERLNEKRYEILKILISLLETSQDSVILCVASHDLGEYMTHYGRGKKVVEHLRGKDALLQLLSHKNPNVKYHALKTLQILMLNNYDLLAEYEIKKLNKKHWDSDDVFGLQAKTEKIFVDKYY